jgi:putative DNA primase/helicase
VKMAAVVPLPPLGPRQNTTELRLALWRNGYLPVPVSGPAMNVKSAGKRPLMKGWETICANPTQEEIVRWAKGERNCTNTGLLCGVPSDGGILGGADIDVPAAHLAEEIARVAVEILGGTPLRRIGAAPKAMFCYRLAETFEKVQTPDLLLKDGTKVKVEFLASGQQFVGFGVHPGTKKPYSWPERDPIDVPLSELPTITPKQARAFVAKAESILRGAGAETKAEKNKQEKDGLRVAGIRKNTPASPEMVREALSFIPNDDLDYDSWVKIGLALYSGLGEAGRQLWEEWSAQSGKNDGAFTADKWPSFAVARSVSIGTVFWEAQQSGWRRGARRLPQPAQTEEKRPAEGRGRDPDDPVGRRQV